MSKPVAIGPTSRTVIGAVADAKESSPTVAAALAPPKPAPKHNWHKLLVPAGIIGAIYLALHYKGHV